MQCGGGYCRKNILPQGSTAVAMSTEWAICTVSIISVSCLNVVLVENAQRALGAAAPLAQCAMMEGATVLLVGKVVLTSMDIAPEGDITTTTGLAILATISIAVDAGKPNISRPGGHRIWMGEKKMGF